jgi:hypothetical protein
VFQVGKKQMKPDSGNGLADLSGHKEGYTGDIGRIECVDPEEQSVTIAFEGRNIV